MTKASANTQTTKKVVCNGSDTWGFIKDKQYTQVGEYDLFPGYKLRTVKDENGKEQNVPYKEFRDAE